jgi:signal transduction histidine kinase/ActR/RegA family two-component response regulator
MPLSHDLRDDLMRGRNLRWFHWLVLTGVLVATLAAWRSAGQPAVLAAGALFGATLFGAFVLQARANRRAIRYADVVGAELRLKNEMLVNAREVALSANRAKDQFLANMEHELRTPLNTVTGLTEAMLRGELGSAERGHAQMVLDASESLLATIEDMLDLARIDGEKLSFESAAFDLHRAIGEAIDELAAHASAKGLQLRGKVDPGMTQFRVGDARRLRQVIVNLLRNAIEFTDAGEIEVAAGRSPAGEADGVRIEVRDPGIGIDPEQARRIFELSSASSARRGSGAGLSLPLCKRLVEQMGGEIGAETRPGGGSTFWFTARLAPCEAGAAPVPAVAPEAVALPKRVLLVEDSIANQRVALAILGPEPEVAIAANGREACALLAERDFDVVLMDVQLPEMDGLEATAEIRAREAGSGRRTPIIAMTACAQADDRSVCLAAGMDDYLSKPVHRDELLAALARVLEARAVTTTAS